MDQEKKWTKKKTTLEHISNASKYPCGINLVYKNNCQSNLKEMTSWGSTYFFHFCGRVLVVTVHVGRAYFTCRNFSHANDPIEEVKNTLRRQVLPKRSATITESQRVGILPTTIQQASRSTQAAAGSSSSSYVYYTPSPIGFGNPPSVLTFQDEGSRHNLSGILSQLPDLTTQITEQPQQQLYTITTTAPLQQQQPPQ